MKLRIFQHVRLAAACVILCILSIAASPLRAQSTAAGNSHQLAVLQAQLQQLRDELARTQQMLADAQHQLADLHAAIDSPQQVHAWAQAQREHEAAHQALARERLRLDHARDTLSRTVRVESEKVEALQTPQQPTYTDLTPLHTVDNNTGYGYTQQYGWPYYYNYTSPGYYGYPGYPGYGYGYNYLGGYYYNRYPLGYVVTPFGLRRSPYYPGEGPPHHVWHHHEHATPQPHIDPTPPTTPAPPSAPVSQPPTTSFPPHLTRPIQPRSIPVDPPGANPNYTRHP